MVFFRKQKKDVESNYGAIELERDEEQSPPHNSSPRSTASTDCGESKSTTPEHAPFFKNKRNISLERLISEVRSVDDEEKIAENNESEVYRDSTSLQRAFPERLFALTITMLLEIPVLLMVSGGSDALCGLIGRRRYQLLVGFLPLTSAISGNVGLQASTLTTRAISHSHVTIQDYGAWLLSEVMAALYLGVGMGCLLGGVAFVAAQDWAFGVTIFMAQVLSILTAGLTGTMAPLIFSFLFHRDSGKWGGPLETAVQDIVGSFAMVVVSYHLLKFLGPGPIDPYDVCGPGSSDSYD
jgi:Mg/Co/Ni transporter MgtE